MNWPIKQLKNVRKVAKFLLYCIENRVNFSCFGKIVKSYNRRYPAVRVLKV